MSEETQTGMDLDDAVELFGHNQAVISELVAEIQSIAEKTILLDKQSKIASFRGQILSMDLENQASRITFLKEFIKTIC